MTTPAPQILYIDSDPENLMGFEISLSNNFDIVTARDAKSAIDVLKSNSRVGVIMFDYRFPFTDNFQLIQSIGAEFPHMVFVVTSAWGGLESVRLAMDSCQLFGFVPKPWNFTELKLILGNALDYSRVKLENIRLAAEMLDLRKKLDTP